MGLVYSQRTSGKFITEDEKMIEETKKVMAEKIISNFLKNMEQLGFSTSQALDLAKTIDKEGQDE
jgi:DNA-binding transcriptional regulator YhcF (GntR family)